MGAKDEGSFGILNKFVDGFFPSKWVTREGDDILGEDGEPTFEACPINTKALVECRTYGDVVAFLDLGKMIERHEHFLKLTHDKNNNKRIVKPNQLMHLGPILDQVKDGSSASSGSRDVVQQAAVSGKKKGRPESEPVDLTEDGLGARAFNLPSCFLEKDFFEGFPLVVSDDESAIIRRLNEEDRRKYMASSMVGTMKVAEMVVVLAGEGASSSSMVSKLESEKVALLEKA